MGPRGPNAEFTFYLPYTITCGTRAKIFADVVWEKWRPKFLIFYAFGPQLDTFMSVGILLK